MEKFFLPDVLHEESGQQTAGRQAAYSEFLRVPALSAGIYRLAENARDPQQPHHEDEIYYILSGSGKIRVGEDVENVQAGDFIYVPAEVEHRFFDIESTLDILVIFAPAET